MASHAVEKGRWASAAGQRVRQRTDPRAAVPQSEGPTTLIDPPVGPLSPVASTFA